MNLKDIFFFGVTIVHLPLDQSIYLDNENFGYAVYFSMHTQRFQMLQLNLKIQKTRLLLSRHQPSSLYGKDFSFLERHLR